MKPKSRAPPTIEFSGGEDEKMRKIVDEMDRFFESVHADIEDWKFSMEDHGDGTRIFVRFQIHINKPADSSATAGSKVKKLSPGKTDDRGEGGLVPAKSKSTDSPEVHEKSPVAGGTGVPSQADTDLASFVELWKNKRESNRGLEFHKEGAPYVDDGSAGKGPKRRGEDAPSDAAD
jgi:hypothetical protein